MNEIKVVTITMKEEELKKLILEAIGKAQPEEILTTDQVAQLLHCTRQCVYNWKQSGDLKAYGKGKKVYYKRSEVLDSLVRINGKAA